MRFGLSSSSPTIGAEIALRAKIIPAPVSDIQATLDAIIRKICILLRINMCERINNLLATILGDQSKQLVVSEMPLHLCESNDPLAHVRQEIAEYKARCKKLGYAECRSSFGTLTREGQQLFLDEFATDEGRDKEGANARIYQTSLQDEDGSALFIRTFGDFGVQIDWRGFD